MASSPATELDLAGSNHAGQARLQLAGARGVYYEDPAGALADAIRCCELGRSLEDDELCARAFALQGMVSLHRGDLRGGLVLAMEAERHAARRTRPRAGRTGLLGPLRKPAWRSPVKSASGPADRQR